MCNSEALNKFLIVQDPLYKIIQEVSLVVGFLTSTIGLLICTTTWILIPKWRVFRNYVYTNILWCCALAEFPWIALLLCDCQIVVDDKTYIEIRRRTFCFVISIKDFGTLALSCWSLIGSLLCYSSLVKIFSVTPTRRLIKSNLFAYSLPGLLTTVELVGCLCRALRIFAWIKIIFYDYYIFQGIILACSILLYVGVVYSIIRQKSLEAQHRTHKTRRVKLQIATMAFCASGFLILVPQFINRFQEHEIVWITLHISRSFQFCTLSVMFTLNRGTNEEVVERIFPQKSDKTGIASSFSRER